MVEMDDTGSFGQVNDTFEDDTETQDFDDLIFALKTGGHFDPNEDEKPATNGHQEHFELRRISIPDTHLWTEKSVYTSENPTNRCGFFNIFWKYIEGGLMHLLLDTWHIEHRTRTTWSLDHLLVLQITLYAGSLVSQSLVIYIVITVELHYIERPREFVRNSEVPAYAGDIHSK